MCDDEDTSPGYKLPKHPQDPDPQPEQEAPEEKPAVDTTADDGETVWRMVHGTLRPFSRATGKRL